MSGRFLRNGTKSKHLIDNMLWRRQSISDSIGAPINRSSSHNQQQSKAYYARFPHSFYRKVKELDLSRSNLLSSAFSSSSTASSSSTSKFGFVGWYLGMVKARPILTKSITSSLIYTAADLSSQTMVQASSEPYDLVRTLRMAGYGLIILGPSLHFWFNFVSKLLPKRDLLATFAKMCLGQLVYGPTMTVVFFSTNAGLQGESGKEIIARLKRDLIPTFISGVMYWPVCDFVTFRFIPVHLQPLVSNAFSYLWTIYMTYMASLEKARTN